MSLIISSRLMNHSATIVADTPMKVSRCPRINPSPRSMDQSNNGLSSGMNRLAAIIPYTNIGSITHQMRSFINVRHSRNQ